MEERRISPQTIFNLIEVNILDFKCNRANYHNYPKPDFAKSTRMSLFNSLSALVIVWKQLISVFQMDANLVNLGEQNK